MFISLTAIWGGGYPAIVRLWEDTWTGSRPFLDDDAEIRRVISSTTQDSDLICPGRSSHLAPDRRAPS